MSGTSNLAYYLFGDQSLETYSFLANFLHRSSPSLLSRTFAENLGDALCREVNSLSNLERNKIPRFSSLEDLNEKYYSSGVKHSGIESALLCATQVAHYLELVFSLPMRFRILRLTVRL
jgi:hypothetical protein